MEDFTAGFGTMPFMGFNELIEDEPEFPLSWESKSLDFPMYPEIRLIEVQPTASSSSSSGITTIQYSQPKEVQVEEGPANVADTAPNAEPMAEKKKRKAPAKKKHDVAPEEKLRKRGSGRSVGSSDQVGPPKKETRKSDRLKANKGKTRRESTGTASSSAYRARAGKRTDAALLANLDMLNSKILNIRPLRKMTNRHAVPDEEKDEDYYSKRVKNTNAAKVCREKKRALDEARVEMIRSQQVEIAELNAKAARLENEVATYKDFVALVSSQMRGAIPPDIQTQQGGSRRQ